MNSPNMNIVYSNKFYICMYVYMYESWVLVNSPVNNTEYICVSSTNDGETSSDPAYIIIAGEYACNSNVS